MHNYYACIKLGAKHLSTCSHNNFLLLKEIQQSTVTSNKLEVVSQVSKLLYVLMQQCTCRNEDLAKDLYRQASCSSDSKFPCKQPLLLHIKFASVLSILPLTKLAPMHAIM